MPDPLLWLLPAVFVLHEVEETVFLPAWLRRHRSELMSRFPRLSGRLLPRLDGISRKEFAIMAVEESLLLVGATACASFVSWPYPWLALFLAFGLMTIHAQDTAYKITGTVPSDVKKVYLGVLTQREPIDSAAVNNGKFEFSGTRQLNEIIYVMTPEGNCPVFNDGTPVDINAVSNTLTGSELNKKLELIH